MELIIAETAGFCMGVDLALHKLDNAVANPPQEGTIYTLGPIIHNPQVLELYQSQGVLQTDGKKNLTAKDVVVIRAHGIPRQILDRFKDQNITIIDATCPKVKKAQILIQKQAEQIKHLLLFGERDHPEVRGLVSYAPKHTVFESLEELRTHTLHDDQRYFLAAQTTQDRESFEAIRNYLLNMDSSMVILDTICAATKDRQEEVRELSSRVQAMIVVGGKSSGNTRRLAQIAQEAGIYVIHIETAEELSFKNLAQFERIGLTAGASTPSWIITAVATSFRKHFNVSCEEKSDDLR